MDTKKILVGFLPWIAFSLIATRVGAGAVGLAALLALVIAAVLVGRSLSRGESVKLLEATAVGTFALMGVWAIVDPTSDAFLADYGRGLAALILAAVIALSSTPASRSRRSTGTRRSSTRSTAGSAPRGPGPPRSWASGT
jgi:hypothetical protein